MIYPYICDECKEGFSLFMPLNTYLLKKEKVICPNCSSTKTRRTYESTPIIFKGEGFTKSIIGGSDE